MKRILSSLLFLFAFQQSAPDTITVSKAYQYIGKEAVVKGTVTSARKAEQVKGTPTFLNMKEDTVQFTVVIWDEVASQFSAQPHTTFTVGKKIAVRGIVQLYRGKPQIKLTKVQNLN